MKVPKIVWDLLFTLAIPVGLLSPDLFKSGFSFSKAWGAVPTYVVAALIPAFYILWDTARTRIINPVTILAASSALMGGILAFLQVDGWKFALKDSYAHLVIFLVMLGSLIVGKPFFGQFIRMVINPDTTERKLLFQRYVSNKQIQKVMLWGTVIILVEALLNAGVNFWVNYKIVLGTFGTEKFNAQVAQANTVMRPISLFSSFIAYGLAFYAMSWASKNEFGEKVNPLEDHFWEGLEQHYAPPSAVNSAD